VTPANIGSSQTLCRFDISVDSFAKEEYFVSVDGSRVFCFPGPKMQINFEAYFASTQLELCANFMVSRSAPVNFRRRRRDRPSSLMSPTFPAKKLLSKDILVQELLIYHVTWFNRIDSLVFGQDLFINWSRPTSLTFRSKTQSRDAEIKPSTGTFL